MLFETPRQLLLGTQKWLKSGNEKGDRALKTYHISENIQS